MKREVFEKRRKIVTSTRLHKGNQTIGEAAETPRGYCPRLQQWIRSLSNGFVGERPRRTKL